MQQGKQAPMKILFFCMPGIGDSLLATPAIHHVKSTFPGCHITALTMFEGAAEVLRTNPDVDEVINWDFSREGVMRSLRFVLSLRHRKFDASILGYPANRLEYNVISRIVGAKQRLGHRYNHLDLLCGNWLNNVSVREDDALTNVGGFKFQVQHPGYGRLHRAFGIQGFSWACC